MTLAVLSETGSETESIFSKSHREWQGWDLNSGLAEGKGQLFLLTPCDLWFKASETFL